MKTLDEMIQAIRATPPTEPGEGAIVDQRVMKLRSWLRDAGIDEVDGARAIVIAVWLGLLWSQESDEAPAFGVLGHVAVVASHVAGDAS